MTDTKSRTSTGSHRWVAPEQEPGVAQPEQASTAELVRQATEQVSRLVRDEFALARTEMMAKGKNAGMAAGMLGAGGVVGLFGLAALLVAVGLALDLVLPGWLAALVVAVGLLAIAGLLAISGRGRVKQTGSVVPTETVRTIRADVDEVKRRAHR